MLHTINKSPFMSSNLETVIRLVQSGDSILFLEDGVYAAQAGTKVQEKINDLKKNASLYVLGPDLEARGISKLIDGVTTVDYDGFVQLTEENKVAPWL